MLCKCLPRDKPPPVQSLIPLRVRDSLNLPPYFKGGDSPETELTPELRALACLFVWVFFAIDEHPFQTARRLVADGNVPTFCLKVRGSLSFCFFVVVSGGVGGVLSLSLLLRFLSFCPCSCVNLLLFCRVCVCVCVCVKSGQIKSIYFNHPSQGNSANY